MSNYEEIKSQAARIFPLKGMAEAAIKQGNTAKAIEYAKQFRDKADEIRATYPDTFAAYVVYMNASGFLYRLLSDTGATYEAYAESHRCLLAIKDLLVTGLTNENACQTLLTQVLQCLFAALDIRKKFGYEAIIELHIQSYLDVSYNLYCRLKKINPNNPLAAQCKQTLDSLNSIGRSADTTTTIDIDKEISMTESSFFLVELSCKD